MSNWGSAVQKAGKVVEDAIDEALEMYWRQDMVSWFPTFPQMFISKGRAIPTGKGPMDRVVGVSSKLWPPRGGLVLFDIKGTKKPVKNEINRVHQLRIMQGFVKILPSCQAGYLVWWHMPAGKRRQAFSEWRWHSVEGLETVFLTRTDRRGRTKKVEHVKLIREGGLLIDRFFRQSFFHDIPSVPDFISQIIKGEEK
jgi:hypothetical protein